MDDQGMGGCNADMQLGYGMGMMGHTDAPSARKGGKSSSKTSGQTTRAKTEATRRQGKDGRKTSQQKDGKSVSKKPATTSQSGQTRPKSTQQQTGQHPGANRKSSSAVKTGATVGTNPDRKTTVPKAASAPTFSPSQTRPKEQPRAAMSRRPPESSSLSVQSPQSVSEQTQSSSSVIPKASQKSGQKSNNTYTAKRTQDSLGESKAKLNQANKYAGSDVNSNLHTSLSRESRGKTACDQSQLGHHMDTDIHASYPFLSQNSHDKPRGTRETTFIQMEDISLASSTVSVSPESTPRQMITRLESLSSRSGTVTITNKLKTEPHENNVHHPSSVKTMQERARRMLAKVESGQNKGNKVKAQSTKPQDFAIFSVMACIFNPIFAVCALFFALRSQDAWETGNRAKAIRNSVCAFLLSFLAVTSAFGLFAIAVYYRIPQIQVEDVSQTTT